VCVRAQQPVSVCRCGERDRERERERERDRERASVCVHSSHSQSAAVWTVSVPHGYTLLTESSSSASISLPNVSDITCSEATFLSAGHTIARSAVPKKVLSSNEIARKTSECMHTRLKQKKPQEDVLPQTNTQKETLTDLWVAAQNSPLQTKTRTLRRACVSSPTAPAASRISWPARSTPIVSSREKPI